MARFGSFEFDPIRRQLFCDGRDVHVTPKAFDLLGLLIDAAPRVVSKAELHQRLWPNGVVSDATLVGLVKELRRALDDHDPSLPLIRTAHRVGYAFCASLQSADRHVAAHALRWLIARGRRLPLVLGENLVGRDPHSHVWLDDVTVSRRHARITVSDDCASIEDLSSKNGTRIGEAPVTGGVRLHNGDRIRFGQVVMQYCESAPDLATATHASRLGTSE